jgi:DNA-binding LytR/AlgR family response regulator
MMQIFILENNPLELRRYTSAFTKQKCKVVGATHTGRESFELAVNSTIDLFVLDIQLEKEKSGFEFARKLYRHNPHVELVYLTDKEEYYDEAFEAEGYPYPFAFLPKSDIRLKGTDKSIQNLLTKFKSYIRNKQQSYMVQIEGQFVSANDIMFVKIMSSENQRPYLNIYLKDGRVLTKMTNLKNLMDKELKEDFIPTLIATNKNLLVNENHIIDVKREKLKDEPATLYFITTTGISYEEETSQKRGAYFYNNNK